MIPNNFTKIFLLALFVKSLIESLLDRRNMKHIQKNRHAVPAQFIDQIDLPSHQKSADYAVTKIVASQVFHFINLVIFLLLTLGGGLELFTRISLSFSLGPKISGLLFFGILGLFSTIISLPETLYTTFVIEEKFGFNKTTWKIFVADIVKGGFLAIVLGAPIAYGILSIMEKLGEHWWLYAFLFLTIFQLILFFIFPTWIAPLFNKFSPLPDGKVKTIIEQLLERVGFHAKAIYVMDASKRSSHGNAYFTGFGKNKRIVFFDTLINSLDEYEIEAVLAHEVGHMKRKHILKGMIKGLIFSLFGFYLLSILMNNPQFFNGHGIQTITHANILAIFSMVAGTYTFLFTPLSSWFSRQYEYEADAFASQHSNAKKLISALVKMYKDNKSFILPDPIYSKFYYSHPPAIERIAFLEKCQDEAL